MPTENGSHYSKPPISLSEQIDRLKTLGIQVTNEEDAKNLLTHTSYYRLKGYLLVFRDLNSPEKPLRQHTTLHEIAELIEFDQRLRNITLSAIDTLEVAIRTILNEKLAQKYNDAFWYQNAGLFDEKKKYGQFLSTCAQNFSRSKDIFIEHYHKTYGKPPLPPGWMLIEVCTLGTWSRVYANLKYSEDKKAVSDAFDVSKKVFQSWLHSLSDLRNTAAHQSRLWNKKFGTKPMIPKSWDSHLITKRQHPFLASSDRYAVMMAMLHSLLSALPMQNTWTPQATALITELPTHRQFNMGFKSNWHEDPFWE